jgi:DNA-binding transcriptional LysR family regulator
MKRLEQVSLRQLRALAAVVRGRSISAAAEEMGLTPPAVHNQLKQLEDVFGCPLIYRSGADAFSASPEGAALITAQHEARSALERAVRQVDALKRGMSGSVILGVVSTAKYFAPALVARLRRALPGIDVALRVGNRERIIDGLARRELDLVIMGRPPRAPLVDAVVLGDHPHLLVAAPDHPLVGHARIDPAALLAEHFVMREPGSGTRILCSRYLEEMGGGREVSATEMDSNETIKQAVINGLGIALLSGHTMVEELRSGRLVTLNAPDLPIVRQWFMAHRSDVELQGAVLTVWDWTLAHRDEVLPVVAPMPPSAALPASSARP